MSTEPAPVSRNNAYYREPESVTRTIDTQKKFDLEIFGVTFVKNEVTKIRPSISCSDVCMLLYWLGLQHTTVGWVDITYLTVA